jgi:hypothetical protein
MADKIHQVRDGEWVAPIMRGYKMQCCQCGLIHLMDFRVDPVRGLEIRGFRQTAEQTDAAAHQTRETFPTVGNVPVSYGWSERISDYSALVKALLPDRGVMSHGR